MDIKDFQLITALHEDARQSYRSLGRRVSLSSPAVRDRLSRLKNRGILNGFWLSIDPSILGRDDLMVFFKGEWTRKEALNALKAPDVVWAAWKINGRLTVQLWPRDPKQAVRVLTGALRARASGQTLGQHHVRQLLSLTDWQIIDALIDDPTLPLKQLCNVTGFSAKTVRKHLMTMIQKEIIYIVPKLGALADSGELVYHLAVFGSVSMSELYPLVGHDAILLNATQKPPVRYLLCRSADLADVTIKTRAVGMISGVKSVTVDLNRELFVATEFMHSLVREQVEALTHTQRHQSNN